jgi:hypothetical protein
LGAAELKAGRFWTAPTARPFFPFGEIPMRKFKDFKRLEQLKIDVPAAGLTLKHDLYDKGSDFITVEGWIRGVAVFVLYSCFNGTFFGSADGLDFSSDASLDGQPWFDALLDLFYIDWSRNSAAA